MKKIIYIIIIVIVALLIFCIRRQDRFDLVFKSEEVENNIRYTEECLLGRIFKKGSEYILCYIKDGEIYIEALDINSKTSALLKKIPRKELDYLRISTPHLISKPGFSDTGSGKILITFNGKNETGDVISRAILYDMKSNSYKRIFFNKIKGKINRSMGSKIAFSNTKDNVFTVEIFDPEKEKFSLAVSVVNPEYSTIEPLKNGKFLILDAWRRPKAVLSGNKVVKLKKHPSILQKRRMTIWRL